eukprot:2485240-Pleurochrysis_carterae.AAC.2
MWSWRRHTHGTRAIFRDVCERLEERGSGARRFALVQCALRRAFMSRHAAFSRLACCCAMRFARSWGAK